MGLSQYSNARRAEKDPKPTSNYSKPASPSPAKYTRFQWQQRSVHGHPGTPHGREGRRRRRKQHSATLRHRTKYL